jgi:Small metal-binding protein
VRIFIILRGDNYEKITLTYASALLLLSMNVFANPHYDEAIKHAIAAAQAGDASKIIEHTLPTLEHTMAGALTAKGLTKTHTDEATRALETTLDLAKAKKSEAATASAQAAVEHLKAANKQ